MHAVCVPTDGTECGFFRSCGLGEVCVSVMRETFAGPFSNAWFCTDPASCIAGRDALGLPETAGCLYGDLTPAITGQVPAVSCDDRAQPWHCGNGCDCGGAACVLASEQHPWGVCSREVRGYCATSASECGPGSACLHIEVPLELLERYLGAAQPDLCLSSAVCESMATLYPDVYTCEPSGR